MIEQPEQTDAGPPLRFATMRDLIEEIQRRAVTSFVLYTVAPKNEPGFQERRMAYSGGMLAAAGLCQYGTMILDEKLRRDASAYCDAWDDHEDDEDGQS